MTAECEGLLRLWLARGADAPDRVMADALADAGMAGFAAHVRSGAPMPAVLDGYDWGEAFGYAGEAGAHVTGGGADRGWASGVEAAAPGMAVGLWPFDRRMVREVYAIAEGEADESDWVCAGLLWDGRYFSLKAWCDYTGWD